MENQTVAQKLEALVKLQSIDSKIDELKKLRGDLPDEVQDLGGLERSAGVRRPGSRGGGGSGMARAKKTSTAARKGFLREDYSWKL